MFTILNVFAESERFELPEPFSSIVFKTTAIDHSANSPIMLEGTDSNRRTRKGADLQSAGFNHSPTFH